MFNLHHVGGGLSGTGPGKALFSDSLAGSPVTPWCVESEIPQQSQNMDKEKPGVTEKKKRI